MGKPRNAIKFMQTLEPPPFHQLQVIAKERGVTVQELLRVVVIPEWLVADGKGNGVQFVQPGFVRRQILKLARKRK